MNLDEFQSLSLRGGFLLRRVVIVRDTMIDAMGRIAVARTTITGSSLEIELGSSNPDPLELSVSLYHEVLEAVAVAAINPPAAVCELNEAGFEASARSSHERLGMASPATLNQMLEEFGF